MQFQMATQCICLVQLLIHGAYAATTCSCKYMGCTADLRLQCYQPRLSLAAAFSLLVGLSLMPCTCGRGAALHIASNSCLSLSALLPLAACKDRCVSLPILSSTSSTAAVSPAGLVCCLQVTRTLLALATLAEALIAMQLYARSTGSADCAILSWTHRMLRLPGGPSQLPTSALTIRYLLCCHSQSTYILARLQYNTND